MKKNLKQTMQKRIKHIGNYKTVRSEILLKPHYINMHLKLKDVSWNNIVSVSKIF